MHQAKYLMEDPREAGRLVAKVDPEMWAAKFIAPHLRDDMHVLDIGCGPGAISRAIADLRSGLSVTGVDLGPTRVEEAKARIGEKGTAVVGDIRQLPFDNALFDMTYCRLLLQFVPELKLAINEMKRVTRPGGRVLAYELDGQLMWHYPEDQRLERLAADLGSAAIHGFDPMVGRKLYHHAISCGLQDVTVDVEPYHLIAGPISSTQREQWQLKLDIARPLSVETLGSESAADEFIAHFMSYLDRPDTLTYSVAFCVSGTVPE